MNTNIYETLDLAAYWDTLTTSFVQFEFVFFALALVGLYYLFPLKLRWTVLLAGSILFYSVSGLEPLITILLTAVIVYLGGIFIEATDKKERKKRRFLATLFAAVLLTVLVFAKLYTFLEWEFHYIVPMGISYYTFSSIAYLADVYWGKERAQRNFFHLALFLLYFPKALQGPISRHKFLCPQLVRGNAFDWHNLTAGAQLAIWGYFKKMIVGDRAAIFAYSVIGSYEDFGGCMLFVAAIISAFQLYCDFSGCMDIARGISRMMGIELERNFDRPFFSRSAGEFWRRWHVTLGAWFKDYVMMPLSISPRIIRPTGAIRKRFGNRPAKAFMVAVPTMIVWLLTGLWHGTGANYVVWGLYWGVIMVISSVFSPEIQKLNGLLHIDTDSAPWHRWQTVRTFLLFCLGRVITSAPTVQAVPEIVLRVLTDPRPWQIFSSTIVSQGLVWQEMLILVSTTAIVWYVDKLQGQMDVRQAIGKWNVVVRCAFWVLMVISILVFGIYGPDTGSITFTYANY